MPRTSQRRGDPGPQDAAPSAGLGSRSSPKSFKRDTSPFLRKNGVDFLPQICVITRGKARPEDGADSAVVAEGRAAGRGEARGQLQPN